MQTRSSGDDYFTLLVIPVGYSQDVAGDGFVTVSLYSDPQQEAYAGLVRDQVQSRLEVSDLLRAFGHVLAAEVGDEAAARILGKTSGRAPKP
jgi:hypothetical protein